MEMGLRPHDANKWSAEDDDVLKDAFGDKTETEREMEELPRGMDKNEFLCSCESPIAWLTNFHCRSSV
jgi:hypothetical protein